MRRGILLIPDNDGDEQKIIEFWTGQKPNNQSNPEQKKIVQEPVCSECGKAVDQKVVNYCKHQFDGVILCRECQEGK